MEKCGTGGSIPKCPQSIRIITRITLVLVAIAALIGVLVTIKAPKGVAIYDVFGYQYHITGSFDKTVILLLHMAFIGVLTFVGISVLRGRMWAYYLFTAGVVYNVLQNIWEIAHRHVGLDIVTILVLYFFLAGYRRYREFVKYESTKGEGSQSELSA